LAIVAARAAADPLPSLVEIAAEMKRAHGTLDAFSDDGLDRDLRAVFNWSYHLLSPGAAHLLRLLARHHAPDISVQVAAGLIGGMPAQAREQLAELLRTRLVNRSGSHHYYMHHLVRVYAGELRTARPAGDRSSFVPSRKAS
jgi:hypothetical protein